MDFIICVANLNILIHSVYDVVNKSIEEYLTDKAITPDIEIYSNMSLIEAECEKMQNINNDIVSHSSVEMLMIQRKIAEALPMYNMFLLHGAAIAVNGVSYIFSAKSGTGKTTHIQHWLEQIKDAYVVNGDKPYIWINEEGVFACGTPWCGKESMGTNSIVPVRSIVFMERSSVNRMERVSFKTALPRLLEQVYHPTDVSNARMTIRLLSKMKDYVNFYFFYFDNFKEDVFRVSYDTLTNQKDKSE